MTSKNKKSGMVSNQSNNNATGLLPSILRLYRNNDTWRGAVDLTLIGILVAILSLGLLDLKGMFSPTPEPAKSVTEPAQQTNANFSPATEPAPAQVAQPVKPVIPEKKKSITSETKTEWLPPIAPDEQKLLEDTDLLIGADNEKVKSIVVPKAEEGKANYQLLYAHLIAKEAFQKNPALKKEPFEKAIYWYKEAALQGQPSAQYELGQIYRLGAQEIRPDIEEAVKWYEMAAKNPYSITGEPENQLGRLYEAGKFFAKDEQKAFEYYQAAAEKNNLYAQGNLGAMYYNGQHVSRDLEKARYWLSKGAENGDLKSQENLSLMYFRGRIGGAPNYAEFIKWAGMAANQGSVNSMMALGEFYREGAEGFPPDFKKSAHYIRLAALKKHPKAQYLFANMYENGRGVPQDYIQAYVYYKLSYDVGNFAPAYSALENLKQSMSPAQIEHGEKMIISIADRN